MLAQRLGLQRETQSTSTTTKKQNIIIKTKIMHIIPTTTIYTLKNVQQKERYDEERKF